MITVKDSMAPPDSVDSRELQDSQEHRAQAVHLEIQEPQVALVVSGQQVTLARPGDRVLQGLLETLDRVESAVTPEPLEAPDRLE